MSNCAQLRMKPTVVRRNSLIPAIHKWAISINQDSVAFLLASDAQQQQKGPHQPSHIKTSKRHSLNLTTSEKEQYKQEQHEKRYDKNTPYNDDMSSYPEDSMLEKYLQSTTTESATAAAHAQYLVPRRRQSLDVNIERAVAMVNERPDLDDDDRFEKCPFGTRRDSLLD